jgi:PBSX family phage terminase large subunit
MYEIEYDPTAEITDYTPYGGAAEAMYSHAPELLLSGPAETGKTLAACWKTHLISCKYPGAQGALVMETYASIPGTVFLTMKRIIKDAPVEVYGGDNKPEKLLYSNGSVIWIGGMDNPNKVLSGERDFIQVCQAEQLKLDAWEIMTTRVTGRGAIYPYPQIFGDCNPGGSKHWILQRAKAGSLQLINSIHDDNPTLYKRDGQLTEQGKKTMARLEALTGVRYKRLRLGIWATADGAVFDMFDSDKHVKKKTRDNFREFRLTLDEGYTNPAVILVLGIDNDGRRHIFEEFYERGKLEKDIVNKAKELGTKYNTNVATVDAAAAGLIAALRNEGFNVRGGKGRILDRIHAIQNDLAVQGDGRPRLTIDPSCVNSINDFESYEWKPDKDEPRKENDHAPDALGYDYDTHGAGSEGGGFAV